VGSVAVSEVRTSDPLINRTIEGYHFIKRLGTGSFGLVYLARHPRIKDRLVAVKYIKLGNPDEAKKVEREVEILARLQHPSVINIYDTYRFDHYQLIVMELLRGGSLLNALRQIPKLLDITTGVSIVEKLAFALGYVHGQNILHLDLKPANILMDPIAHGEEARLVLTDFGIAQIVNPSAVRSTNIVGTPAYMSPEHFGYGNSKPDYRSDIYSLGIILYELLVGRVPFHSTQLLELLNQHAYSPVPLASQALPGIPPQLDGIILKAMAKNPGDRFQSASEMGSALRELRLGALANFPKGDDRVSGQALGIIAQSGANAMESIHENYPATEEASLFNLMVIHPDGSAESAHFYDQSMILGRDKSADLQLKQSTISRRHAQIDCDRHGNLYVTDLQSANGTYLDGVRLTPAERVPWRPAQYLQIQGYLLQIEDRAGEPRAEPSLAKTDQVVGLLNELQQQESKPFIRCNLSPDVIYVEPDRPHHVQVIVTPENTPLARYELRASPGPGIDERWYTLPAGQAIAAGDSYTFDLMVSAPATGTAGGMTHEIALEVVSDHEEVPSAIQILKVRVVPFTRFMIALQPSEITHKRRPQADLVIINTGNQSDIFTIDIEAPDTLRVTPAEPQIEIQPGQEATVSLHLKTTRDARRARGRLVYSVIAYATSGVSERTHGSYVFRRKQRIPAGLIVLWVLLVVIITRQLVSGVPVMEQFEEVRAVFEHVAGLISR
jgi:serine/threonine protein kinase